MQDQEVPDKTTCRPVLLAFFKVGICDVMDNIEKKKQ